MVDTKIRRSYQLNFRNDTYLSLSTNNLSRISNIRADKKH